MAITAVGATIAIAAAVVAAPVAITAAVSIAAAAVITTGATVATAAYTESTMVMDASVSMGDNKMGIAAVIDFKNDTIDIYDHGGKQASTGSSLSASYGVGFVENYNGIGDYAGLAATGGASYNGVGLEYSHSGDNPAATDAVRATMLTFSSSGNTGAYAGIDWYISRYSYSWGKQKEVS